MEKDKKISESEKSFDDLKKEILKRGNKASACNKGYKDAKNATAPEELLTVIKNNIEWCVKHEIVSADYLEECFGKKLLIENNIYTSGNHHVSVDKDCSIVLLGSSSANVETWDSSSANVKTFDTSSANVKTFDTSSANVETWDSSSANVKTLGSSSANVETWGSSSANVETWGTSSKVTYALGNGKANLIKDFNNKKIYIKKSDFEIIEV